MIVITIIVFSNLPIHRLSFVSFVHFNLIILDQVVELEGNEVFDGYLTKGATDTRMEVMEEEGEGED